MVKGIFLVLAACFCWGGVFVIPQMLKEFNPFEIALGRYFVFGVISLGLLFVFKRNLLQKSYVSLWIKSLGFSFFSTLGGYVGLVYCVHYASGPIATLIFGLAPMMIPIVGNLYKKEFLYRSFVLPCCLMFLGILCVNIEALKGQTSSFSLFMLGVLGAVISLGMWVWYTIANFHFLRKNPSISSIDLVIMIGVSTFFLVILFSLLLPSSLINFSRYFTFSLEIQKFLFCSSLLGIFCSFVAFLLWNYGNKLLPISLAGQLTIFEMIFGLLFIYYLEKRVPLYLELTGIIFMIAGVLVGFRNLPYLDFVHSKKD